MRAVASDLPAVRTTDDFHRQVTLELVVPDPEDHSHAATGDLPLVEIAAGVLPDELSQRIFLPR